MADAKTRLNVFCQKNKILTPNYHTWSNEIHVPTSLSPNFSSSGVPMWYSQAKVMINDQMISTDISPIFSTKLEAEKYVADLLLKQLVSFINNQELTCIRRSVPLISSPSPKQLSLPDESDIDIIFNKFGSGVTISSETQYYDKIYLVDLENKQIFHKQLDSSILYIGFISSTHSTIEKYSSWITCDSDDISKELDRTHANTYLYKIDGGVRELVDHFMTMMIYPLIEFIVSTTKEMEQKKTQIYIITNDNSGWCTRACFEKIIKWRNLKNIEVINTVKI